MIMDRHRIVLHPVILLSLERKFLSNLFPPLKSLEILLIRYSNIRCFFGYLRYLYYLVPDFFIGLLGSYWMLSDVYLNRELLYFFRFLLYLLDLSILLNSLLDSVLYVYYFLVMFDLIRV